MSATLIHHGHIRLLKKAFKIGDVYVALTKDQEIKKKKGYIPELKYKQRYEILESVKYIKKIIPSNWDITDQFIKKNRIDILVHGKDEINSVKNVKKIIYNRTKGISSRKIRFLAYKNYLKKK